MPSTCRRFLAVLWAVLAFATARAQAPADAAAGRGVEAALAAWAEAKSGDEAQRERALRQLAPFEDPRVTAALLDELDRAGVQPAAVHVLAAIAQHPRGNIVPRLRAVLLRPDATDPIRRAAAIAIGKQGNRGIDLLLECARGEGDVPDAVRDPCLDGLALARDERAWRGLAPLALQGGTPRQLRVLRLLEACKDVAVVTQVRLRLLQESDAELAAVAWRQLAQNGWERARDAFEGLLDRIGKAPPAPARAELVAGLAAVIEPDLFADFLELADSDAPIVRLALQLNATRLAKNGELLRFLAANALLAGQPARCEVAFVVLRAAPLPTVQPLLAKARAQLEPPRRETIALATGLHGLLQKDPTWKDEVVRLLRASDPAVRTAALAMLLELGADDGLAAAQQGLDDKSWELRAIAIRYLARCRALASIPLLIARTDKETGRLAEELNDALFVHTGVRLWRRAEWEAWWSRHKDGHELPPEAAVQNAGKAPSGPTVAWFGLPLQSHHAAFLIDVSGSMKELIGTDHKRTRLDEARRQLRNALDKLPEDREFNIVVYEGAVKALWDSLRKGKPKQKQEAAELLAQLSPHGGTNIHDALELAFKDPGVDTIYLLTDGQPTAGRIVDIDQLADQVRRWNYQRQVVVHCIAIGEDSRLLKRLAADSGGQYVFVH